MSTIYTVSHTNLAVAKARPVLSIPTTKKSTFLIGMPPEAFLTRMVVYQLGGASTAFEVELFNSLLPFPVGDYNLADAAATKLEPFRVQTPPTGPLTALAGATLVLDPTAIGLAYRNLDGTQNEGIQALYLHIKPTSTPGNTTTWCAHLYARVEPRS